MENKATGDGKVEWRSSVCMGMVNARLRLRMKELTDNEEKTWKETFNPAYEVRGLFPPLQISPMLLPCQGYLSTRERLTDRKCLWVWQNPVSLTVCCPHASLSCHSWHLICIKIIFCPLAQPFSIRQELTHRYRYRISKQCNSVYYNLD